jgi:hypothetical protein
MAKEFKVTYETTNYKSSEYVLRHVFKKDLIKFIEKIKNSPDGWDYTLNGNPMPFHLEGMFTADKYYPRLGTIYGGNITTIGKAFIEGNDIVIYGNSGDTTRVHDAANIS